jgi:CRP/FNR family transcriptional regulator, nitrogen fixation regulation protein
MLQTNIQIAPSKRSATRVTEPAPVAHALSGPIEMMGAPMTFRRNSEIYGEGEPADFVYKVLSGTVRTYKLLSDGRRQIGAFYLSGDVFGLDVGDEHAYSAEAITESKILVVKRNTLINLAARDSDVARELWKLTGHELERVQDHVLLLVKSAQERVAGFLLEMAERRHAGDTVQLPMSRQDIADYLGLTIETVSRTLSNLEHDATIELSNSRCIVLRNRSALAEMNA